MGHLYPSGDNHEADIIGTKNAEMKAIWKRNLAWQEAKEADESLWLFLKLYVYHNSLKEAIA